MVTVQRRLLNDVSVLFDLIFRSTLRQSRPKKAGLKRAYLHIFGFNEIQHVCRGRGVMHDGMQYDPIQGQGHEPLKLEIWPFPTLSPAIYNAGWQLTADY